MYKQISLLLVSALLTQHASAIPTGELEARNITSIETYPPFQFYGDAPWPSDPRTMGNVMTCPYGVVGPDSNPVLMVHGTGSSGLESYGNVIGPLLKANGYEPCWVDLPQRSMQDNQITAGFVAYNLHLLSSLAGGRQVAVVAHSSGNPVTQWGLRWWPSTHKVTRAYVALAPDFQGVGANILIKICAMFTHVGGRQLCSPSIWQQVHGSKFMDAFGKYARTAQIPTTVAWTLDDEVVVPSFETSKMPGSSRMAIQEICPFKIVDHDLMLIDSVAGAIMIDALANGGYADKHRISKKNCFKFVPDRKVFEFRAAVVAGWNDLAKGIFGQVVVTEEPALASYVHA